MNLFSIHRLVLFVAVFASGACASAHKTVTSGANPAEDTGLSSSVELSIAPVQADRGGTLLVALFESEESWLVDARARRIVAADRDTVRVRFEDVPAGRYAAAVIHDENGNGELDVRTLPFPKPKEGLAVSNNQWGFGRPAWEPATFQVGSEPIVLDLVLRY